LWPNPVREELNIAWRGDLKRMPAIIELHDLLGRLIDRQPLESWRGSGRWDCSGFQAGMYLLEVYDRLGHLLATTTVVKE
jgi:hypothetical protein